MVFSFFGSQYSLFLSLFYFFIQAKVHPYWPQKASSKVERFIIELNSELTFGDYIVRELKPTNAEVQMNFNFILFLQYFYFWRVVFLWAIMLWEVDEICGNSIPPEIIRKGLFIKNNCT